MMTPLQLVMVKETVSSIHRNYSAALFTSLWLIFQLSMFQTFISTTYLKMERGEVALTGGLV